MLISSKDNPSIKRLSKLLTSRKARKESGEFVIEGIRSCYDAACELSRGGKLEITGFYRTSESLEKAAVSFDTGKFSAVDSSVCYEITEQLAERLSAGSSQGMFMTAKMLDKPLTAGAIRQNGRYAVLVNVQDPGNVGTIMRSADAFGIDGVVLAGSCCDLYNPKVIRSAMGSIARTPVFISGSEWEAAGLFKASGIRNIASVIADGEDITGADFSSGCAVYIGNEGHGLDREFSADCDERITIRMFGSIDSLNAAMAATVILWEMTRGGSQGGR